MLNPFGEDDDDFEINVLIDRHIKVKEITVFCGILEDSAVWHLVLPLAS